MNENLKRFSSWNRSFWASLLPR